VINYTAIVENGTGSPYPNDFGEFADDNDGFAVLAPNTTTVFRAFMPNGGVGGIYVTDSCSDNTSCHLSIIFSKDRWSDFIDHTCDINSPPVFKCYTAMDCWTRNTLFKAIMAYNNGLQRVNLSTRVVPMEVPNYVPEDGTRFPSLAD
jgi:hypothetical protein